MDPHRRRRWLFFVLSILIGLAAGLYYGWVVRPVRYIDTSPDTLRQDYKADFVLMVAEAWEATGDLDMARRYLALLGGDPVAQVEQALRYAAQVGYGPADLHRMRNLLQALRGAATEAAP
ncbi:MAG: hypothetical protein GXO37_00070 [Chloroflexi bacterium]|nr:hypothetical protein [Chloroflexota bacterium]